MKEEYEDGLKACKTTNPYDPTDYYWHIEYGMMHESYAKESNVKKVVYWVPARDLYEQLTFMSPGECNDNSLCTTMMPYPWCKKHRLSNDVPKDKE